MHEFDEYMIALPVILVRRPIGSGAAGATLALTLAETFPIIILLDFCQLQGEFTESDVPRNSRF